MKKFVCALCAAGFLALAPVTILPADGGVIAVSTACGQASSCAPLDDYVCSTFHKDWDDKVCYTGCGQT